MKTLMLSLVRLYYSLYSVINPRRAGAKAFRLFQKTRKLPLKKAELGFYNQARSFTVTYPHENLHAYETGNPEGKLVVIVHGWESNAGSMGAIANMLAHEGYRVVALDLPAHGKSTLTHTNLYACREALRALIFHLNPTAPFSIVSHSFGSAVSTYALSGSRYEVDQFIMLTSPNRLIDIFNEFKNIIGLGNKAYQYLLNKAESILNERVETVTVEDKARDIRVKAITILHDINDKVLPYANSLRLGSKLPQAELITLKDVGHYRMLWNADVIKRIQTSLKNVTKAEEVELV
ncbi:MAG: alpha/beta hydrolase [Cyclobacteriaceae bacterium]|nr:MAG: alpha/beta hydrolase [Cyclobacteriaceae bacterium]